jgi:outer membrane protein
MSRTLLLLLLLLSANALTAQDKWSLERCIQHALKNNIQIKMQELSAYNAKNANLKNHAAFLPSVNASASQGYTYGRSVDMFTNEFSNENVRSNNFGLNGSWTLFNGFQNVNTLQQGKLNMEASVYDVEKMRNDISLSIASAFLQILFMEEIYYVAEQQVEVSKIQVDRAKKLFDAGTVAQGNYLEMESQLASDEMQLVIAKNNLDMAYLTLIQLLELDSVDNFELEKPIIPDISLESAILNPNEVYQTAEGNLPQVRSAELKWKASMKGLSVARGYRSPRLTLNGSYSSGYSSARQTIDSYSAGTPMLSGFAMNGTDIYDVYSYNMNYNYKTPSFNDQMRDNVSKSLTFSLSIPIFNNWQTNYSVSSAKVNSLNAKYNLDLTKKQLMKDIRQAHADAVASLNKFVASKKALAAMEESFSYIQQKFDVGMVNLADYNISRKNLISTRSEQIKAKYEYIFKLKILDFYMGKPITL